MTIWHTTPPNKYPNQCWDAPLREPRQNGALRHLHGTAMLPRSGLAQKVNGFHQRYSNSATVITRLVWTWTNFLMKTYPLLNHGSTSLAAAPIVQRWLEVRQLVGKTDGPKAHRLGHWVQLSQLLQSLVVTGPCWSHLFGQYNRFFDVATLVATGDINVWYKDYRVICAGLPGAYCNCFTRCRLAMAVQLFSSLHTQLTQCLLPALVVWLLCRLQAIWTTLVSGGNGLRQAPPME